MKLNKRLLWAFVFIVILSLCWMNISSISTVLLGIKGSITDGNLIRFSGVTGVGEDAGVAASNVTKNKFDATIAPTVNNDVDEGYTVGSKWYDVTADEAYICLDNTDGAAVWIGITLGEGVTKTGDFTSGRITKINNSTGIIEQGTNTDTDVADAVTKKHSQNTDTAAGGEWDFGAHSAGFTLQTATGDGTTTIDWRLGIKFKFTFGAQNDVFTFIAPSKPCSLTLVLVQDGTGSRTATWPGTVKWPAGTDPTLSTAAGAEDIVCFFHDGTSYYGAPLLNFSAP